MKETLTIYANKCLTCGGGDRNYKIQAFAKRHNLDIVTKRVYMFPELEKEALSFGGVMPFIAYKGKTIDYYSVNDSLIEGDPELEQLTKE